MMSTSAASPFKSEALFESSRSTLRKLGGPTMGNSFPGILKLPRQSLLVSGNLVLLQGTWLSLKLPENTLLILSCSWGLGLGQEAQLQLHKAIIILST